MIAYIPKQKIVQGLFGFLRTESPASLRIDTTGSDYLHIAGIQKTACR